MAYGVRLHVWGRNALFTRPEFKAERVSYDAMTPSAARGILEAIYWKPAIRWVVQRIHLLEPIKFQTLRRNEVSNKVAAREIKRAMRNSDLQTLRLLADENRQQRSSVVLVSPAYVIEAHFKLVQRNDGDDDEGKHLDIFNRRADRGQCFHQPCLGTREFAASFALVPHGAPLPPRNPLTHNTEHGFGCPRDLGFMLWDIDHAAPGRPSLFFSAKLNEGVLEIPPSCSPLVQR